MVRGWVQLILLLVVLIGAQACSDPVTGEHKNQNGKQATSSFKPKLDVELELDGDTATVRVITDMHINANQYGQARKEGEGHVHMYLDEGEKIGVKQEIQLLEDLPSGKHTLKVSLHNNDHTPYDVTKTIEFEVP